MSVLTSILVMLQEILHRVWGRFEVVALVAHFDLIVLAKLDDQYHDDDIVLRIICWYMHGFYIQRKLKSLMMRNIFLGACLYTLQNQI